MADSEKTYEFKKALKRLQQFSGSGTELISVYIPSGSPIHETANKLKEEMGQASNIKSKSTRTNVVSALEKILQHFKIYRQTPGYGLAVFAGNVSDNPAKTNIELFAIEPPQKLSIGTYRCDSKFFLEPLQAMIDHADTYGIVVMDGREATLAMLRGTQVDVVKRLHSMAHSKHNAGGQCLHENTLVMKDDGTITEIKNIKINDKIRVADFGKNKIISGACKDIFSREEDESYILKTYRPQMEIHATKEHTFFVLDNGIKEKYVEDLKNGDIVLVSRNIDFAGREIPIDYEGHFKIDLTDKGRELLKQRRQELALTQEAVSNQLNVHQMTVSRMERGEWFLSEEKISDLADIYNVDISQELIKTPQLQLATHLTEGFAQFLGYATGDGHCDEDRIVLYESKKEVVDKYANIVYKEFNIEPKIRIVDKIGKPGSWTKNKYSEIRVQSAYLTRLVKEKYSEITKNSYEKDIPTDIMRAENRISAAFIRGLFDAEGYIHGKRIDIAMTSKRLIKKLQLLLLRFGIVSSFSEKRVKKGRQWYLSISDKRSLGNYKKYIGFTRSDKVTKIDGMIASETKHQYNDKMPISGRAIYTLLKEAGVAVHKFKHSLFFTNKRSISRKNFEEKILVLLREMAKENKKLEMIVQFLEGIVNGDIGIAEIAVKEKIDKKERFYDITIEKYENFLADGIIVHNSARRFERLIQESIEYYYKKVGDAMDEHFVGKVKGVVLGGPGPTKDMFMKMKPFNYQLHVMGVVDTGYTDEVGIHEILAKSENIIKEQEAIKEKVLIDHFIKEVVNDGLATYGEKQVREAIMTKQAEKVLISEGLEYKKLSYVCGSCQRVEEKISKEKAHEKIPCTCGQEMKLEKEKELLEDLVELAHENAIPIEIISTNTNEGLQLLNGFAGIGAFLRYKTR